MWLSEWWSLFSDINSRRKYWGEKKSRKKNVYFPVSRSYNLTRSGRRHCGHRLGRFLFFYCPSVALWCNSKDSYVTFKRAEERNESTSINGSGERTVQYRLYDTAWPSSSTDGTVKRSELSKLGQPNVVDGDQAEVLPLSLPLSFVGKALWPSTDRYMFSRSSFLSFISIYIVMSRLAFTFLFISFSHRPALDVGSNARTSGSRRFERVKWNATKWLKLCQDMELFII